MLYLFQDSVLKFWGFWCGLFEPLPYGDPYIAASALFIVFVVSCRLITGRGEAS